MDDTQPTMDNGRIEKLPNTLAYALLGLLAREPCSGYDLMHALKKIGAFWQARHSQIYPELASLESRGLVTYETVEQTGKPDKKLYAITDAGRMALGEWVNAPTELPTRRDEFVLKALSLWLADPQRALLHLRDHARQHDERRVHYEQIQAWKECGAQGIPPIDSPAFSRYIVLQRGISYEREYAAWCRWVADLLEQQLKEH